MALLKFKCKKCSKVFDELVSYAFIRDVRCPDCGGEVERAYEGKCQPHNKAGCTGNCSGCHSCRNGI